MTSIHGLDQLKAHVATLPAATKERLHNKTWTEIAKDDALKNLAYNDSGGGGTGWSGKFVNA